MSPTTETAPNELLVEQAAPRVDGDRSPNAHRGPGPHDSMAARRVVYPTLIRNLVTAWGSADRG